MRTQNDDGGVCTLCYSVHTDKVHGSDRVFPLEEGAVEEERVFY